MIEWKSKWANRYALMIEGACRVGKSYIVDTELLISHAFSENKAAFADIVKAILATKNGIRYLPLYMAPLVTDKEKGD